jgi:hypothetical protein
LVMTMDQFACAPDTTGITTWSANSAPAALARSRVARARCT